MRDQAEKLRMKINEQSQHLAKTVAVVSGKGGVGKSNISINTAMILNKKGFRVLLFDLDIGMGNVNIILGSTSPLTLFDYLQKNASIADIVFKTDEGVSYISAGNGLNETVDLNEWMLTRLLEGLKELQQNYDYIIFDMAAGATSATLKLLLAAEDIIVVSTPEPTAMTDAYSMMKFICLEGSESRFFLVCNRADHEKQGNDTLYRLQQTALKFLNKEIVLLGVLPEDKHVRKAVISQTAFSLKFPTSNISSKLEKIVNIYLKNEQIVDYREENDSFIGKLRRFFFKMEERN